MSKGHLETVLRHIRNRSGPPAAANLSDGELLRRFAASREEGAFAALVQRHGPLVLSVCRRVLRHQQDAEDAFQATFLILARKAGSVHRSESLASWLFGVAHRTALRAKTDAAKRRHRPGRSKPVAEPDPPTEASLRELQRLLDEEVNRLPEKYRAPFVLCCLEGNSRAEAARQLGWNEGTLSGRLALARKQLQRRLTRRGISLTAALCVVALAPSARAEVPGALAGATVEGGVQFTAGKAGGTVSVQAVALAEGVLRSMSLSRTGLAVALLLVLTVAGAGAGMFTLQALAGKPAAAEPPEVLGPPATDRNESRADRYGDALPPDAVARLGTVRFRPRGGCRPWPVHDSAPGLAFLPGDKTLVTMASGVIEFWDVTTGKEVRRVEDPGWAFANTLSPDGKTLVAETRDSAAHLWDAVTGKELHQLTGRTVWFSDAAFSADGRRLVATLLVADPEGRKGPWWAVWETATGKELRRFENENMVPVAIAPDGKTVAGVDSPSSSTVHLRDVATGKKLHTFGPLGMVEKLVFTPDGKTLAALEVGDGGSRVHLWDVAGGKLRTRLKTPDSVSSVAFAPDGRTVATAHLESIHVWDVSTGEWVERFEGKGCFTADLAFSGDGKTLATGGNDTVRLWDVASGKEVPSPGGGHQGGVKALAFLADGKTLVTVGEDQTLRHWEATTGQEVRRFPGVGCPDGVGSFAAEGKVLALCVDREVLLCEPATGKELSRFRYPDFVAHAALTPDGKTLAVYSGGKDLTLRLVDATTGKERLARQYPEFIQTMAFSPDGAILAVGLACDRKTLQDGAVRLLDVSSGREVHQLRLSDNASAFAFSPDGKTLATPDMQGINRLWEVATGMERAQLPEIERPAMAFSPDGRVLAVGDKDGTVRLCVAATGKELRRLPGHRRGIACLAFSADGKTLASGSWDTTALVWDVSALLERKEEQPRTLESGQVETFWTDLAGDDAARAFRAIQALAAAPQQTVPFFKGRLRPVSLAEPKQIAPLLADLDSADFGVREKATAELEKLGESAAPALRQALEAKPSLEVRQRVEAVLRKLRKESPGPQRLREMRALEVLEQVGGTEVRRLLGSLAEGAPEAHLTQEARGALERLERRTR
jgi:RNA polymerase sigma factor (sigma-70 family)